MLHSTTTDREASPLSRAIALLRTKNTLTKAEFLELNDILYELSDAQYIALESDPANKSNWQAYDRWLRNHSFPVTIVMGSLLAFSIFFGFMLVITS